MHISCAQQLVTTRQGSEDLEHSFHHFRKVPLDSAHSSASMVTKSLQEGKRKLTSIFSLYCFLSFCLFGEK
jgi:hypothetical protein